MSNRIIVGNKTTQKTPRHLLALFANRRALAEAMIDEANLILSDSFYSSHAKREAREQRMNGIKMQAMYA